AQAAHLNDIDDLRRRKAMAPDVEPLLDRPQQVLVPLDCELRMQAALHQNACASEVEGLLNFVEDHFLGVHITLGMAHGPVKGAKAAIFGAEIGVIDVAVDDVAGDSFRMQLTARLVGSHADSDEVVAPEQVDRFRPGHHTEAPETAADSNRAAYLR